MIMWCRRPATGRNPKMVEWFAQMVEERKKNHDHSKEKKKW